MSYTPSYTLENLHTLEQAMASGTLRVRYGDKEVWYKNTADMILTINAMKKELGLIDPNSQRKFADYSKGV